MEKGLIQVYSGEGHGKSAAALGRAVQMASMGRDVVIIPEKLSERGVFKKNGARDQNLPL